MKSDWQTKNFESCLDKVVYTKKIQRKDFLKNGEFPIVSQESKLINGYWNDKKDLFHTIEPIIIFGDHTKVLKYVNFDFVLGADGVKILKPKNFIDPRFFYYFLQNVELKNLGYARHYRLLREINISFPEPLFDQQRIVKILDEAFEKIDKAKENIEKNIQNIKTLHESYFNGIFNDKQKGWVKKRLCEICEKITDGTHQTPKYFNDGIVFLSSKNVTSGEINWKDIKYIDKVQHQEMHKRVAPRIGDILLAKNGTTGIAAVVDRDVIFDIYVSLAMLRPKEFISPEFLLHFVNSPVAKKQFNKRLKGIGVPNLHLEEIREVEIYYPESKKEQKEIVLQIKNFLCELKKLESIYRQKLNNLDELKKSILNKAFSGEL